MGQHLTVMLEQNCQGLRQHCPHLQSQGMPLYCKIISKCSSPSQLVTVVEINYCSDGLPGILYALYSSMAGCLGLRDLDGAVTSQGGARYGLIGLYD